MPRQLRLAIVQPAQTILLSPLRLTALLGRTVSDLRTENYRLSRLAAELAIENARLEARAGTGSESPADSLLLVHAPVIARDPVTFERYLVVSRGRNHGIRPGNPVIAPTGVAGKVIAAGPHQALVQTLLATGSRVAVMNLRSRMSGVSRPAQAGALAIDYLPKEADYKVGDTVVTAGLGEVFPKGLRVGTVVSTPDDKGALFKPVLIRPFVDFSRLEAVFVLCLPESPLLAPRDSTRASPDSVRPDAGWLENTVPAEVTIPEDLPGP
jgi:rod shape-determining protein MreC